MKDLKDYVFYVLTKNPDLSKEEGFSYGVKRCSSTSHDSYFTSFLGIYPDLTENIVVSRDWSSTLEDLARDGHVIIANTAIEIEELKNRWYAIMLPSILNMFQIKELENSIPELEQVRFDVGVYGDYEESFRNIRIKKDFDSYRFLQNYLLFQKNNIENMKKKVKVK